MAVASLSAALRPSRSLTAAPVRGGRGLHGRIRVPGDKSISHRALIFGAMATGTTQIDGLLEGADVLATMAAVEALGARVERIGEHGWRVEGQGKLTQAAGVIDCGNSGTGARLLMGAVSGYPIVTRFDGDASLRRRPMQRVTGPLTEMGAAIAASEGGRFPLTLTGSNELRAIEHWQEVPSAQVKSAVLLAALNAYSDSVIYEREATRDHTERMLAAFGARIKVSDLPGAKTIRLPGRQKLRGTRVVVPGDPSSAAFPIVAALLVPGSEITVEDVLLNDLRIGLYETLEAMGADLLVDNEREEGGERVGDVTARFSSLRGVEVPAERAPSMIDEYPILAVAAAFADGPTIMRGLGELRHKESDRLTLITQGLGACGVEVEPLEDGIIVHGRGMPPLGAADIATGGDHRIAMAHLMLGLASERPVTVDEADMIDTSFPGFAALMNSLGADVGER